MTWFSLRKGIFPYLSPVSKQIINVFKALGAFVVLLWVVTCNSHSTTNFIFVCGECSGWGRPLYNSCFGSTFFYYRYHTSTRKVAQIHILTPDSDIIQRRATAWVSLFEQGRKSRSERYRWFGLLVFALNGHQNGHQNGQQSGHQTNKLVLICLAEFKASPES